VLDLFRFPTVAGLARHLAGEEAGPPPDVSKKALSEQERAARQRRWAAQERLRGPVRKTVRE